MDTNIGHTLVLPEIPHSDRAVMAAGDKLVGGAPF